MKRIDVHYAGRSYSIGGRDFGEVQVEVEAAQRDGGWLLVNDGEGTRRDAKLWLGAGVPIVLVPIDADSAGAHSG
ncbi:hypothetical protein M4I32_07895 [Microbacterium sp. LRZ72]|uniref:hypothetical protein n=1 Tax=Microbacterium sp. LRZ72 TaxID=2942481 RepID=UPI0029B167E6|nr:hypothetical protein [Microbacterium sp. LRZ72]MDX2376720.1 hypothetical protein [Microbacterium sp. LRZ72]